MRGAKRSGSAARAVGKRNPKRPGKRAATRRTAGWGRLWMELWAQLKNEDWSYVTGWVNWPLRLWDFTQHHQFIGRAGAEGVGYYAPASVGAALANKKHGRISVSIQPD